MKSISTFFAFILLITLTSTFTASFAQLPWTKYANNPVMTGGASGAWNRLAMMPNVLYNSDSSRYEMWYAASPVSPLRPYCIGFATSPDGISWTWTSYPNPVLEPDVGTWDESTVEGQTVLRENGQYKMWYTGWSPTNENGGIGYATSLDGINWTKYANNPVLVGTAAWEIGGAAYCTVMPVQGGYKMWYSGSNANWTEANIGYATSPDGINWTTLPNPVLTTGTPGQWDNPLIYDPNVIFLDSVYHMWYTGMRSSTNTRKIGWATSDDGSQWTKYDDTNTTSVLYAACDPVLIPTPGQWDGGEVETGTVMLEGDSLRMWYTGWVSPAPPNLLGIGHATSPIVINVPGNAPTIQAGIDAASDGNIVLVEDGTYYENINFKGKAITVASRYLMDGDTSHISNTIIDGSQPSNPDSGSVVYFISGEDTTSVLTGLTITGGTGTPVIWVPGWDPEKSGAGVLVARSGAKIESNKIINNNITATGSVIHANGAGITAVGETGDYIIIRGNEISQNTSTAASLCFGAVGLATKETCLFENNRLINNVCNSNVTSSGGGIWIDGQLGWQGPYIIRNNVIRNNEAHGPSARGGGMWISGASPQITNNTLSNNFATGFGGGLYVSGSQANIKVMNTILWGNSAISGSEIYVLTGSITVRYSDIQGSWPGEGNINDDPLLVADSLAGTSPCIGTGIDVYDFGSGVVLYCPSYDNNGRFRPYPAGSMPDIGAWESKLAVPVGIEPKPLSEIPKSYALLQNYPNPFNPSTTIEFDLPKTSEVSLKVFNILGEEVATLVSDRLSTGSYSYEWDATNLASGVYLYRLQAGDYVETKKMILMR